MLTHWSYVFLALTHWYIFHHHQRRFMRLLNILSISSLMSQCQRNSANANQRQASQNLFQNIYPHLTLWDRDKMAAIFQKTFSTPFSWMKKFEFRLKCHWNLFLRVQLTIFQHWFRYWLGADYATSHYLNQWLLDYRHIYASIGLNELNFFMRITVKLSLHERKPAFVKITAACVLLAWKFYALS